MSTTRYIGRILWMILFLLQAKRIHHILARFCPVCVKDHNTALIHIKHTKSVHCLATSRLSSCSFLLAPASQQIRTSAAFTKARNGGEGFPGLDLNSGWNCELKKNLCPGISAISILPLFFPLNFIPLDSIC